jgi:hypothetical protein
VATNISSGTGGPINDGGGQPVSAGGAMDPEARANSIAPPGEGVETEIDLGKLLQMMTSACTASARKLQEEMAQAPWRDSPVIYTIPTMKVSMKVSLTSTREQVKGILWWKTTQGSTAESLSQIELEIVATPNRAAT